MDINGVLIIDKPTDWTSHDVVAKLRGALRIKRIGHGGTLDPMATGVLPIFIGQATQRSSTSTDADKEYIAGIKFGVVTDTQDITGKVLSENDASVTAQELKAIIPRFTGPQKQIPPMYSAKKQGGKKLYELARKNIEVEREPREIEIKEFELLGDNLFRIKCSKGTYVRTLCHDIGTALGCGAAMSSLRRTMSGIYRIEDAVTLENALDLISKGEIEKCLIK